MNLGYANQRKHGTTKSKAGTMPTIIKFLKLSVPFNCFCVQVNLLMSEKMPVCM